MVKRPAMPIEKKRGKMISVRLTLPEHNRLERLAKDRGVKPSVYLRDAALNDFMKPGIGHNSGLSRLLSDVAELRAQNLHLARIGTNLNQLARHANAYKGASNLAYLREGIDKLRQDLAAAFNRDQGAS